jgi:hypothetical protein
MCLSFLSVWFRVDSGLGQWFFAAWLKFVKSRFRVCFGICRNVIFLLGLDLGLFWVGLTLYLAFVSRFI